MITSPVSRLNTTASTFSFVPFMYNVGFTVYICIYVLQMDQTGTQNFKPAKRIFRCLILLLQSLIT